MLDQTGYLEAISATSNSEEANERIENLMELVSAARELRDARRRSVARRVRRSPVAPVGGRRGIGQRANAQRLADDDARGQGTGVPGR